MKEGDLLEWLRAAVLLIPPMATYEGKVQEPSTYSVWEVRHVGWSSVHARIWEKYSLMPGKE